MSTVVDATAGSDEDADRARRDPFAGDRIELRDSELRAVSPSAWFEGVRRRLDEFATRFVYGR